MNTTTSGRHEPQTGIPVPAPAAEGATAAAAPATTRVSSRQWLTRRRLGWIAAGLAAAALLAAALRPSPEQVEMGVVLRGPLEVTVDADGVTRLLDRFRVDAPVNGRLERITAREGDAVQAGEVLAHIGPVPLDVQARLQAQARLTAATASAAEGEARVAQTQDALDQTARSTARIRAVAAAGGMSVDALDRAETQLALATREHQAARSRAQVAGAEVEVARAALLSADVNRASAGRTAVRTPVAGRVLRVHEPSERMIMAGAPLVEIGDPAGLEVVVDVLSTDAVRIREGSPAHLDQWGGEGSLNAVVRRVEPAGFTKVSTLGVEEQRVNVILGLAAPPATLGDGYRVQARIVTWTSPDVLKVPNSTLFRSGEQWQVFVVENGRARRRPVRVGQRGIAEAEIIDGLRAGEEVVLFPSDRLQDGVRVRTRQ